MRNIDIYSNAIIASVLFLSMLFGVVAPIVLNRMMIDNQSMTQQPAPASQPIATVPSSTSEPAPSQVDFEDMAGLDAATQRLLNERYQGQGPGDFEKRLRRLEWAVSALTDRVFGKSVLPGESGQIGELGDAGESESASD